MPSITRTSEQEDALEKVTTELEELAIIESLLEKSGEGKEYCVSVADGKRPPKIRVPDNMKDKIEKILITRKSFLTKDAIATAKKWNIEFEDTEKVLLGLSNGSEEPKATLFDTLDDSDTHNTEEPEQGLFSDNDIAAAASGAENSFSDVDADDEEPFDEDEYTASDKHDVS